jgi:metacaspase-1
VLAVWNNGGFKGSYATFHGAVRSRLPPTQSPNLFTVGSAGRFLLQRPFTV